MEPAGVEGTSALSAQTPQGNRSFVNVLQASFQLSSSLWISQGRRVLSGPSSPFDIGKGAESELEQDVPLRRVMRDRPMTGKLFDDKHLASWKDPSRLIMSSFGSKKRDSSLFVISSNSEPDASDGNKERSFKDESGELNASNSSSLDDNPVFEKGELSSENDEKEYEFATKMTMQMIRLGTSRNLMIEDASELDETISTPLSLSL